MYSSNKPLELQANRHKFGFQKQMYLSHTIAKFHEVYVTSRVHTLQVGPREDGLGKYFLQSEGRRE